MTLFSYLKNDYGARVKKITRSLTAAHPGEFSRDAAAHEPGLPHPGNTVIMNQATS
jgi:hypothetical protein